MPFELLPLRRHNNLNPIPEVFDISLSWLFILPRSKNICHFNKGPFLLSVSLYHPRAILNKKSALREKVVAAGRCHYGSEFNPSSGLNFISSLNVICHIFTFIQFAVSALVASPLNAVTKSREHWSWQKAKWKILPSENFHILRKLGANLRFLALNISL